MQQPVHSVYPGRDSLSRAESAIVAEPVRGLFPAVKRGGSVMKRMLQYVFPVLALVLWCPAVGAQENAGAARAAYSACVLDHGAQADGTTDDTAAFQAALAAASEKGGIVLAPAGTYHIAGTLEVPQGVCLKGVWEAPHHADIGKGTVLYATGNKGHEDGPPFILLNQSSAVKGITIFYPEQAATDIQPYPWCIQGKGMHCTVENVTLVNPYKGIDFGTHWNELHLVNNVFGQPLKLGIYVNQTTDIGRIQNVHFNPHAWKRAAHESADFDFQVLIDYLKNNFTGFLIAKTDWEYLRDCFCIFPKIGFHFIADEKKGPGNAVLTQCGADICPVAVKVDASQPHAGIAFVNAQIMGTVIVSPTNSGPVKFTNSGFWTIPETKEQVIVDGSGTVTLNACHFTNWDSAREGHPCVRIDGGSAIIQGCEFKHEEKKQILIGEKAESVVVSSCRLRGGAKIENLNPDADVQIGLNIR
jgi:hypothetical protein